MTIFGLTEGQVFGEDQIAKFDLSPALPGVAARPSGGLFRFWVVILLNPNQLGIPHLLRCEVKRLRLFA
jgi:hypothetical protein